MAKQVKVRASRDGHDGKQYRGQGQVFHVPAERLKDGSDWFERVDADEQEEPETPEA